MRKIKDWFMTFNNHLDRKVDNKMGEVFEEKNGRNIINSSITFHDAMKAGLAIVNEELLSFSRNLFQFKLFPWELKKIEQLIKNTIYEKYDYVFEKCVSIQILQTEDIINYKFNKIKDDMKNEAISEFELLIEINRQINNHRRLKIFFGILGTIFVALIGALIGGFINKYFFLK